MAAQNPRRKERMKGCHGLLTKPFKLELPVCVALTKQKYDCLMLEH